MMYVLYFLLLLSLYYTDACVYVLYILNFLSPKASIWPTRKVSHKALYFSYIS